MLDTRYTFSVLLYVILLYHCFIGFICFHFDDKRSFHYITDAPLKRIQCVIFPTPREIMVQISITRPDMAQSCHHYVQLSKFKEVSITLYTQHGFSRWTLELIQSVCLIDGYNLCTREHTKALVTSQFKIIY